jgi:hypothetical protein
MTIRDQLKRRFGLGLIAVVVCFVLTGFIVSIAGDYAKSPLLTVGLAIS